VAPWWSPKRRKWLINRYWPLLSTAKRKDTWD
jgi:hypothetical protein